MSKFKIGDKIVCFNDSFGTSKNQYLEKYKIYTVNKIQLKLLCVEEIKNEYFSEKRFISLKDYRLRKIKNILK
jgi:hypothetical protein